MKAYRASLMVALGLLPGLTPSQAQTPAPRLEIPIACQPGKTCEIQNHVDRDPTLAARDHRCGTRTYDGHNGVDIRLPDMAAQGRGVAVLAAAAGQVSRVRNDEPDVSVRERGEAAIKGRECGNGLVINHAGGLSTQYCHMAKGSISVRAGQSVTAGTPLGLVGLSGNTEYPHLHFTVRRDDQVVDPFAPDAGKAGTCGAGTGLWSPAAGQALAYRSEAVLNSGFAGSTVSMEQVEAGRLPGPTRTSSVLVVYVRAIGLKSGDIQSLSLLGPGGQVLAATTSPPLPRDRAQQLLYVGKPRRDASWPAGRYLATYRVSRSGAIALEHTLSVSL